MIILLLSAFTLQDNPHKSLAHNFALKLFIDITEISQVWKELLEQELGDELLEVSKLFFLQSPHLQLNFSKNQSKSTLNYKVHHFCIKSFRRFDYEEWY
jgi:hypothetical protein